MARPSPSADPDRFKEAIESFAKRSPVTRPEWDEMTAVEREHAFTVAGVTQGRILQDVMDSVGRAIREGKTLQDFREEIGLKLIESWGGEIPGRIEVVFRTNTQVAYNEGRHAMYSAPTVKQARPYLRCDGVADNRQSQICAELDGVIRPQEEWATKLPPFHYNCRCVLTPLSADEAEEEGVADKMPDVEPDDGFGNAPSKDGENWEPDLSEMDPELAGEVENAIDEAPDDFEISDDDLLALFPEVFEQDEGGDENEDKKRNKGESKKPKKSKAA